MYPVDLLETMFTYHAPTLEQVHRYRQIRDAAKEFAKLIGELTPYTAENMSAIRYIDMAVMCANAAIARHDK